MPYKDPDQQRAYQRAWVLSKRDSDRESTRRKDRDSKKDRIQWLDAMKEGRPCMDCGGVFPPVAMDFDHRPGEIKVSGVCEMVRGRWSKEKILAEVAKCDLVCANCHRVRTHK